MRLNVYAVRSFNVLNNGTRTDQTTTKVAAEGDSAAFETVKLNVMLGDASVAEVHSVSVALEVADVLFVTGEADEASSAIEDARLAGHKQGYEEGEADASLKVRDEITALKQQVEELQSENAGLVAAALDRHAVVPETANASAVESAPGQAIPEAQAPNVGVSEQAAPAV